MSQNRLSEQRDVKAKKQRHVKAKGCQSKGLSEQRHVKAKACRSKGMSKQRHVQAKGCQSKGLSEQRHVEAKACRSKGMSKQGMSKQRYVKAKACQSKGMSEQRAVRAKACQSKGMSKQRHVKAKACQSKGMSKQRHVKAKGCQSKGMSKQRHVKAKACQSKGVSKQRHVKAKACQSKGVSKQRDVKAKACQSKGMPKQRDVRAKGCQSKGMSKQRDVKAKGWEVSHESSKFSHLPLSLLEGSLARKLFFHIFHFHFWREVSHESFVFTSSTFTFGGKSRTKAFFSHLPLSLLEGSLARKPGFHIFHFYFWREVAHESFVFASSTFTFGGVSRTKAPLSHLPLNFTFWGKPGTKAVFAHLSLSLCEGSLAGNAFLRVSRCTKCCVCRTKRVPEDGWGSVSGGRVPDGRGCTGIILGSLGVVLPTFLRVVLWCSMMFCNSVSADRTIMAASRLLGAAAACVILLSLCSWTS